MDKTQVNQLCQRLITEKLAQHQQERAEADVKLKRAKETLVQVAMRVRPEELKTQVQAVYDAEGEVDVLRKSSEELRELRQNLTDLQADEELERKTHELPKGSGVVVAPPPPMRFIAPTEDHPADQQILGEQP